MTGWECASFGVTRRERDNEKTLGEKWGGIAGGGQEGSRVGMGAIGGGITGLSDSECNRGRISEFGEIARTLLISASM